MLINRALEHFHLGKLKLCTCSTTPHYPFSQPLVTTILLSVCMNLTTFDAPCK